MFAGKTSALLAQTRRYKVINHKVFAITHASDTRYTMSAAIVSHNRDSLQAHAVTSLSSVRDEPEYKEAHVVVIEEAHFFGDLYDFVKSAVEEDGKHIICVGLNGDAERRPFGQILDLIPLADTVTKIDALCSLCKDIPTPGIFTRRTVDEEAQILVGGSDKYEAVCRKHYLRQL